MGARGEDYRRYALPAIEGRQVRYNNLFLRDIIMQADIDGDGDVNGTEFNSTLWDASFVLDVVEDVLHSQSPLREHILEALATLKTVGGLTTAILADTLTRRNASDSHELRDIALAENDLGGLGYEMVAFQSDSALASIFNNTLQLGVDDAIDMFDLLIQLKDESDDAFRIRLQSGVELHAAIPSLRRILTNDWTGKMSDKPYEEIDSSFKPRGQIAADTSDLLTDTEL